MAAQSLRNLDNCSDSPGKSERIMFVNGERVLYFGLHGKPTVREFGALTCYFSLDRPFRLTAEHRPPVTTMRAIVPAYCRHEIVSPDRLISALLIEPESVDPGCRLFAPESPETEAMLEVAHDRILNFHKLLMGPDNLVRPTPVAQDLDQVVFGRDLPQGQLDHRIRLLIDQMIELPSEQFPAEACAESLGLSFSRFLHLFRDEVGTTFRRFRAWKRARSLLEYVTLRPNLTDIALDAGYPDASHFSHSIRQIYGLKPKEIFAGSRRLEVHCRSKVAAI